jgi:hypothetical protein
MDMKKIFSDIAKALPIFIAVLGGITGFIGAYVSYDNTEFKQTFDKHISMANSFQSQIASAEKRKDHKEANRIRIAYEEFEEAWRKSQILVGKIDKALSSDKISQNDIDAIKTLSLEVEKDSLVSNIQQVPIGFAKIFYGDVKGGNDILQSLGSIQMNKNIDLTKIKNMYIIDNLNNFRIEAAKK